MAAGPIGEALTADALSQAFGLPISIERNDGRFRAWLDDGEPGSEPR